MNADSVTAPFPVRMLIVVGFVLSLMIPAVPQAVASPRPTELIFGLEPEHNIFDQLERYRELTGYLSEKLEIPVRLTIMSRYGEVVQRFQKRRIDGAFLSSFTATLAIQEFQLLPLAGPVHLLGRSTSQGIIFARSDSGIKTINDMKGKRFVFVDPAATEGYLFPMAYLRKHGLQDKETFFSGYYFSGSNDSALFSVLDGRADIGAAKDTAFNTLITGDPSIKSELNVIATSQPVPEVTLCIRSKVPVDLRNRLLSILLNMNTTVRGRAVLKKIKVLRFAKINASDFDIISKMAEDAGITMTDYQ